MQQSWRAKWRKHHWNPRWIGFTDLGQTRTYVHLSLRDQDNAILKAYGIKVDEDATIKEEQPKECQRCHELTPSDASYCRKCWLPFTQEQAIEFQEKENELTSFLENSKVLDPNLVNMLKEAKP